MKNLPAKMEFAIPENAYTPTPHSRDWIFMGVGNLQDQKN